MANLIRSQTNLEEVETSPFAHKYLLKKPRMLSRSTTNSSLNLQTLSHVTSPAPQSGTVHARHPSLIGGDEIDNPAIEKRRFELFIDLIWVGIISNLAEHFSDQAFGPDSSLSIGEAMFEFIILFLIAWRIWKDLQEFMTKYHTNDLVERLFVVWIIILAMLYGNNAPFLLDTHAPSNVPIIVFLVILASFIVIEAAYSVYLPSLRRELLLRVAFSIAILGLWIPATFVITFPTRAGLVYAAISVEFLAAAFLDTPMAEQLLKKDHSENFDPDHWVERIQDFFIIILGEGVMSLIKGSPLGRGITARAGSGVQVLMTFYVLCGFYFSGDQSRRYVHAVRRTWWRKLLWLSFHSVMSGSTLILGVSTIPLIQNPSTNTISVKDPGQSPDESDDQLILVLYSTKWAVSVALSITLACQTGIALLSRSLDHKGCLKISNRYVRLLPRMLVIVIVLCLPIDRHLTASTFMGIIIALLLLCLNWEWFASLERGGGIFEP